MRQRGTLRIHFTTEDLIRTYLVDVPDPMWETVLSLHILQGRAGQMAFGEWRRRVRGDLYRRGAAGAVRERLFSVVPRSGYFPDFLTPPEGRLGLEAGIEAMCGVPPRRLAVELERLGGENDPSSWRRALAERGTRTRSELGESFRTYHQAALRPYWADVQSRVHADRALRSRLLREGGIDALLSSFAPYMRWRAPVLEADYPVDQELRLDGRGLLIIPSYFCWRHPVTFADPELPPTLVYPVEHDAQWLTRAASPGRAEEVLACSRADPCRGAPGDDRRSDDRGDRRPRRHLPGGSQPAHDDAPRRRSDHQPASGQPHDPRPDAPGVGSSRPAGAGRRLPSPAGLTCGGDRPAGGDHLGRSLTASAGLSPR